MIDPVTPANIAADVPFINLVNQNIDKQRNNDELRLKFTPVQ